MKKLHSGILRRLYSCRNSQCSPFLHSPRSQCLQTSELSPPDGCDARPSAACRSAHRVPFGHDPVWNALHAGRSAASPTWYVCRRKAEKRKLYGCGAEWLRIAYAAESLAAGGAA
ncbi:hypothetical protein CDD83_10019 [Cordyceps sp. RAO-2017]|nr:hypothetical protein CDD83_10019 [Cordyceps sp. RAO-2017]